MQKVKNPQMERTSGHPRWVMALVILGTIVTLLAIFSIWANRQALNTDNWVNTSDRLLANEQVDEQLSAFIAEQIFAHVDVKEKLEEALPEKLAPLASAAAGGLQGLAPQVAERVLEAPRTQALWSEANRRAHEALLRVLDGGGKNLSTENGEVVLDLRPLVEEVGERVGVSELATKLPEGAGRITILRSEELSTAQKIVKLIRRLPIVLTLLALVLFGLAVFLAGSRRRRALRSVGVGFVVAGVLALVLRAIGGHYVVDALASSETVRPAAQAVWEIGTSLLVTIAGSTIAFGVLVFLAAWLAGPTAPATAIRRAAAPHVRDHDWVAYAAAATLFLILVAWAPVDAFRRPLGMLVLAILLAVGAEVMRRQIAREFPHAQAGEESARIRASAESFFRGSGEDRPRGGGSGDA
ncbi:MAG: hypothetical protein JSS97_13780 [Actinobacteria bacterium]|nr:hypothetical protein [Actinomycetota bacterium]